jgi:RNA binding exosome subunit
MAEKSPIQSVEISTIAHATEDTSKVEAALRKLLLDISLPFTRRYLEGHHGNPIVKVDAKLSHKDAVKFATSLIQLLSRSERLQIQRDLALHIDSEGNLYIRLNKQKLFLGEVRLGEEDPIRVRIKFNRLIGEAKVAMTGFLESE